jgi:hypothetical protein
MTYRELTMVDVREVLRRWGAGHSNRQIARQTGTDRDTVGRYVKAAKEVGLIESSIDALTDELIRRRPACTGTPGTGAQPRMAGGGGAQGSNRTVARGEAAIVAE